MTTMGGNVKAQLKSIIERIEKLEEEKKTISDDIRDVYAESKSSGFDVPTIRSIIKHRKEDADKRANREALIETYLHALGDLAETPLGRAAVERAVA